jgi:hypothetical protein
VFAAYSTSMLKSYFSIDSKMVPQCNQLVELRFDATRVLTPRCGWLWHGARENHCPSGQVRRRRLVVQGQTEQRGQTVTLAGRYKTRTGGSGRFAFRVPYLPRDCLAEIQAGQEFYLVSIANCRHR